MPDNNSQFDPKKYNFTEKETRVVLEDIHADFKVFGEALSDTNRKVSEISKDLSEVKEDVGVIKVDVNNLKTDMKEVKTDVSDLKTDVSALKIDMNWVKEQLNDIKERLDSDHITRQEFEEVKQKVSHLEMLIKSTT